MGTMALESQVHVSLNKTVIAENKVSSGLSRFAASSTLLYSSTVGTHSALYSISLLSLCSSHSSFITIYFWVFFHLCSSSSHYGNWEMVYCSSLPFSFFHVLAVDSKLELSISFHGWLASLIVVLLGQNKFLFRANLFAPSFNFISVFYSPEPSVSPHLSFFFSSPLFPLCYRPPLRKNIQ